eukprot:XP_001701815.1 predicted protein [Chlamydomonas reinhardtii]
MCIGGASARGTSGGRLTAPALGLSSSSTATQKGLAKLQPGQLVMLASQLPAYRETQCSRPAAKQPCLRHPVPSYAPTARRGKSGGGRCPAEAVVRRQRARSVFFAVGRGAAVREDRKRAAELFGGYIFDTLLELRPRLALVEVPRAPLEELAQQQDIAGKLLLSPPADVQSRCAAMSAAGVALAHAGSSRQHGSSCKLQPRKRPADAEATAAVALWTRAAKRLCSTAPTEATQASLGTDLRLAPKGLVAAKAQTRRERFSRGIREERGAASRQQEPLASTSFGGYSKEGSDRRHYWRRPQQEPQDGGGTDPPVESGDTRGGEGDGETGRQAQEGRQERQQNQSRGQAGSGAGAHGGLAAPAVALTKWQTSSKSGFADVLQPGTPVLLSVSTKQPDYARHLAPHRPRIPPSAVLPSRAQRNTAAEIFAVTRWMELDPASWVWINSPLEQLQMDLVEVVRHYADAVDALLQQSRAAAATATYAAAPAPAPAQLPAGAVTTDRDGGRGSGPGTSRPPKPRLQQPQAMMQHQASKHPRQLLNTATAAAAEVVAAATATAATGRSAEAGAAALLIPNGAREANFSQGHAPSQGKDQALAAGQRQSSISELLSGARRVFEANQELVASRSAAAKQKTAEAARREREAEKRVREAERRAAQAEQLAAQAQAREQEAQQARAQAEQRQQQAEKERDAAVAEATAAVARARKLEADREALRQQRDARADDIGNGMAVPEEEPLHKLAGEGGLQTCQ